MHWEKDLYCEELERDGLYDDNDELEYEYFQEMTAPDGYKDTCPVLGPGEEMPF